MKLIMIVALYVAGSLQAQNELLSSGIARVHAGFDQWEESQMVEGKAILERALAISPDDPDVLYWLAFANYRLAIRAFFGTANGDEDKAEKLVTSAMKYLERAIERRRSSDAYALLGSLTGMSIQFSPISGMWKGPRSNGQFADAIKLNPENPRAYYLQGIGKLNTPEMFGGGAEKSIPSLVKALALYEKEATLADTVPEIPRWGHAECAAFLGNAYLKLKDYDQARLAFENALAINPNVRLARSGLVKLETALSNR